jgi:hypothetical protein
MHTIKVIAGGFLLLGAFLLLGRWMGGGTSSALATAAICFVPVWLVVAGVNLWVGVSRAGYPLADEVPYFIVVFAVPAAAAGVLWWWFSKLAGS